MAVANTKRPRPVDRHVGARIRVQRRVLGMTQQKLADIIGIALAQLRKYETGTNRVSASRLQQIALALKVTPASYFDGAPIVRSGPKVPPRIKDYVSSPQGISLSRAFAKISDRKVRSSIVTLVERIASSRRKAATLSGFRR
jgi:transcriptional regulator with XRE-family HTH domain